LTAHTDDGFHEIQLNGKQLVFLFMAATVVSVVIFLCGVLVGRGVRAERIDVESAELGTIAEPAPQSSAVATPPPGSDPTAAAAPPAPEELSYPGILDESKPGAGELKPATPAAPRSAERPPAAPTRTAAATPAAAPPIAAQSLPTPAKPAVRVPATSSSEPSGSGYAVQIAALNIRSEADAIAKRLVSKGYAAYVMAPPTGKPQIYRVRIGKFGSRREADTIATRLEKEEQFKPWVTR
jgi:cell division septation protein DedD